MRSRDDAGGSLPAARAVPAGIRRAVEVEAGFRCAVCHGTSSLELHHIVPFAQAGGHEADNLILVCATCHGRCDCGEISREDLRAVKRLLRDKQGATTIDDITVRRIVATSLSEVFENLQPGLERLRRLAADHDVTVSGLVQGIYGARSSQLIMAALDSGDYHRAQELFRAQIEEEVPLLTLNAMALQPLALATLQTREDGSSVDSRLLGERVARVQVSAGSVGPMSLANAVVLTQEVPDHYMGLPFLKLDILGLMRIEVSTKIKDDIAAHLVALGLAYRSRISDVDYDYVYFHKFTLAGIKFRQWLLEQHEAASA